MTIAMVIGSTGSKLYEHQEGNFIDYIDVLITFNTCRTNV